MYQTVYDQILRRIQSGGYAEGEKLPSDAELRELFGVSMITLNKALNMLADEGYLARVPGRGTFVSALTPQNKAPAARRSKKLIGAVLEHVTTPFGLEMMYRMDLCAKEAGYKLIIRFSYGDREKETEEIRFLLEQEVSGLIIMPSHGEHYSAAILKLYIDGFPVVMVDKKLSGIPLPSVRTDNSAAVARLVQELHGRGAKRLCFAYPGYDDVISVQERKSGFLAETRRLGLRECHMLSLPAEADAESFLNNAPSIAVVAELKKHLEEHARTTDAVIAAEYGIVPSLVCAANELGLVPGENFRVACIDEDALAPRGYTFMHMKQDECAIAKKAVTLLLDRMAGRAVLQESHLIPALFYAGEQKA